MDKTTKAFVIAACSVVILTLVFWIGYQVLQSTQIELQRRITASLADESRS